MSQALTASNLPHVHLLLFLVWEENRTFPANGKMLSVAAQKGVRANTLIARVRITSPWFLLRHLKNRNEQQRDLGSVFPAHAGE